MPNMATYSTSKKKVKDGGAMTAYNGTVYALKGGKTLEVWQYGPGTALFASRTDREGIMTAGVSGIRNASLAISPNPLASGFATLRYSLPQAGPMSVTVHDVTGRTVMAKTVLASKAGSVALDLRTLNAGVYLVKLTADGYTSASKLVVQH
jgi:hypothetical protein